jgi:hypothetical protein
MSIMNHKKLEKKIREKKLEEKNWKKKGILVEHGGLVDLHASKFASLKVQGGGIIAGYLRRYRKPPPSTFLGNFDAEGKKLDVDKEENGIVDNVPSIEEDVDKEENGIVDNVPSNGIVGNVPNIEELDGKGNFGEEIVAAPLFSWSVARIRTRLDAQTDSLQTGLNLIEVLDGGKLIFAQGSELGEGVKVLVNGHGSQILETNGGYPDLSVGNYWYYFTDLDSETVSNRIATQTESGRSSSSSSSSDTHAPERTYESYHDSEPGTSGNGQLEHALEHAPGQYVTYDWFWRAARCYSSVFVRKGAAVAGNLGVQDAGWIHVAGKLLEKSQISATGAGEPIQPASTLIQIEVTGTGNND